MEMSLHWLFLKIFLLVPYLIIDSEWFFCNYWETSYGKTHNVFPYDVSSISFIKGIMNGNELALVISEDILTCSISNY